MCEECECLWQQREHGFMSPAAAPCQGAWECWLPYPSRKGTSPELDHALRILFGLPQEFVRHGYRPLKATKRLHFAEL